MVHSKDHLYLASRSPRRRELLKQIGVPFEVIVPEVDESRRQGESPRDYVVRVCRDKADAGWRYLKVRKLPPYPVLTADTTVVLGDEIIGKPAGREDAQHILQRLSGNTHQVLTAVSLICQERHETRLSVTEVEFVTLTEQDIRRYIASGESGDKAGAYGIQGKAAMFVSRLSGSYSGVMGLPLFETSQLLAAFGLTDW